MMNDDLLVMSNPWLERRWIARVGEPFRTAAFVNRQSGRDYARLGSREFSFAVNGRMVSADDFVFERQNLARIENSRKVHAIVHLACHSLRIELELHAEIYDDYPVIRKWLVIRNASAETMVITHLDWEVVNLLVDSRATAQVWVDYMTRREKSATVTMDDGVFLIHDEAHGEGFIVATEAPGPLKRLEAYATGSQIAVGYNRDDETTFERILLPGEQFQTAASFILPYANRIPQDVVDTTYARFVAEHLTICDPARVPTIVVNTWLPHLYDLNRDLLLAEVDRAAELGVDAYQVDAGWYDRLGDWNADPTKFPNGLEEIADHVRARGMRFGLWMAVATADETSAPCREHPEWIARDRTGAPNRHPMPGTVTMCLDSGYYDYIHSKIDDVIRRYGVELLKLDLSVVRNLYAPGLYPGCFAKNHGHRSPAESHLRLVERLFELIRTLKRDHSDCLVDLSYELYGVMDGTDLALTQVADQNWFTNLTSPNEISLRREVYQRGRVVAPWTLNYGGTLLNEPSAPHYGLLSALTAHATFWGNLADLDDAQCAHYRRWFDWAKAERAHGDFYRYYRVSNIFPPPDGLSSRDYRHAIPTQRYGTPQWTIHPPGFDPVSDHPGNFWDGVARLDERGEGPVLLFRPAACVAGVFQLRLPWVARDARYRVQDVTAEREMGVFTGEELIERGVEVLLSEPATACILTLRRL